MSRQAIIVAISIAAALFCAVLAVILRDGRSKVTPGAEVFYSLQALNERLDGVEDRVDSRLGQIERELLSREPASRGISTIGEESSHGPGGSEPEAEASRRESSEDDGPLENVLARLDELEQRVRGLEEDPIARAYSFLQSENGELRHQGIHALERIAAHDPEARAAIRQMLQDSDARVRLAALGALANIGDKESIPLMAQLLGDLDNNVRRETVETLGRMGAQQAGGDIAQLLKDADPGVRERAADVLGRLRFPGGAETLVQALGDSSEEVRGEAIAALGEIGAKSAAPVLRELYAKDPGRHRVRLINALRALGDSGPFRQEVGRLSQTALGSNNESERTNAIRMLGWFAREEAREVFKQALSDPSERVRREADRALRGRE